MKKLSYQTVYITGGSKGIGLAMAKEFATCGANIAIFARSKIPLENAVAEIKTHAQSHTQRINGYSMDATDEHIVATTIDDAIKLSGICDLLVCCPGGAAPNYFENISSDAFEKTLTSNLYATRHTISAALPHMKEKGGHIVTVSSIAGFLGVFGYTDYCAAKFAIIGFSEALKAEMKRYGIRVSVLCPPDTDTPGFEDENKTKPIETQTVSKNATLMSPEAVAQSLITGLRRGQFIIIPGLDGKVVWRLKRFFPGFIEWIMDRTIKKVQKTTKNRVP